MLCPSTPSKIRPAHLERQAFIYIRQSTLFQVRVHTASTARQYDLAQRARDLGWPREHITIIDQDQGHSGASTAGRDGFQSLLVEVGLGRAGAVLSLEVSRLARSSSDWYRLLEICALTDTLGMDAEGVYDPGQYNDRLLLGFKGAMSEAELHWLRSRLLGGKLEKAQHGALRCWPPAGFVVDPAGQVVFRSRRGSATGCPPPLHPLCPVRVGPGRREACHRPSSPLSHPRVGETPRHRAPLGTPHAHPCPGGAA
jgi:DNA invertase Pin-like site-specific DNA recombinase